VDFLAEGALAVFTEVDGALHPLRNEASRRRHVSPFPAELCKLHVEIEQKAAIPKQQVKDLIGHLFP
jgi:hypothetical protein